MIRSYESRASPGVSLWSTKIGSFVPDPAAAACAVQFGRDFGADVMSLALSMDPYTALTDQLNIAYNSGVVIVSSAGNTDGGAVVYPGTLDAVIAVAATDYNNNRASFSAVGSQVELSAPGTTTTHQTGLTSTCINSTSCPFIGSKRIEGTSFAAPHVAGAAAVLAAANYSWSNLEIRRRLRAGATPLGPPNRDPYFGYGLVNVTGALAADPPLLSGVELQGMSSVPNGYTTEFEAFPIGGLSPFRFTWSIDGAIQQESDSHQFSWTASSSYMVSVSVQDARGHTAANSLYVTVCPGFEIQC